MNKYGNRNEQAVLDKLIKQRLMRKLRQGDIAGHLKIDRTTYVRKERGEIPITTDEWLMIADFLSIKASVFFT